MTGTIFDLVEEDLPKGKEGFLALAKNAPKPKDNSFFDSVADYAKTFLKGTVEGVSRLGKIMGPTSSSDIFSTKTSNQELEEQTENLNELLPTEEGFTQSALRRGLKETPTMLAFPGSTLATLPRSIAAGFLGEGAKELGAPEWAQTAAELTAYIGPDITKKLLSSGKNKELIQKAKELGLSDEALTPLLQSDFKQKWLTKISPKRGKTQEVLTKTKSALGKTYSKIQESSPAQQALSSPATDNLITGIEEKMFKMPSGVRSKITEDFRDLINHPITGDSLMNFYVDVNQVLGKSTKQLSTLKDPIKNALKSISPELGENFETINKLYSKYYPIAQKLKPTLSSDLIGSAKNIGLLTSIIFGYYPTILEFAGAAATSKIAQQLLINPRFQQISNKMVKAINDNKFGIAKKLTDLLAHQFQKTNPEIYEELQSITINDLEELFKSHKKTSEQQ